MHAEHARARTQYACTQTQLCKRKNGISQCRRNPLYQASGMFVLYCRAGVGGSVDTYRDRVRMKVGHNYFSEAPLTKERQ